MLRRLILRRLMWRRLTRPLLLGTAAILLAACHRAPSPMPDVFPEHAGAWRRTALREIRPAEAPDPVSHASIKRIRVASYEGPGKLDARLYQMTSPAVALDVVQRWQAAPDTVFFCSDHYFVVVHWDSAERMALRNFVSGIEKKLNAKQ